MDPRDLHAVETVMRQPFDGYSRQSQVTWNPFLNRVVACVALLGAMVLSGMVLGAPASSAVRTDR